MYRYRDTGGSTATSLQRIKHIQKLGKIKSIRGYRYSTVLSKDFDNPTPISGLERVIITGENGSARFNGFCWSYQGEGPRGLVKLLQHCGVPQNVAEKVAFNAPRNSKDGTDWALDFHPNGYTFSERKIK